MYNSLRTPLLIAGKRRLLEAWVRIDNDGLVPGGRAGDHYLTVKLDHVDLARDVPVPLLGTTIWVDIEGVAMGVAVGRARAHLLSLVWRT
jgi:hypothetical protein